MSQKPNHLSELVPLGLRWRFRVESHTFPELVILVVDDRIGQNSYTDQFSEPSLVSNAAGSGSFYHVRWGTICDWVAQPGVTSFKEEGIEPPSNISH